MAMSSQRATRGREDRRREQEKEDQAEIKKLREKPNRSNKDEKRLHVLQNRLQEFPKSSTEETLPYQSEPSGEMEDATYTAPPASENGNLKQSTRREANDETDSEASESESQKSSSTSERDRSKDSSTQSSSKTPNTAPQTSKEAEKYRFAAAYCRAQSPVGKSRIIYGYGDKGNAKYEIGDPEAVTENDLEKLPFISTKEKSIFNIKKKGLPLYNFLNIERIVNVASLKFKPGQGWRTTKKGKVIHVFPTTILKIKWTKIQSDHQSMLLNGESWNLRSTITARLNGKDKVTLDSWIREVAFKQDLDHQNWLREKKISGHQRPPTFFPGEDWARESPPREKSTGARGRSEKPQPKAANDKAQLYGLPENGNRFSGRKRARSPSASLDNTKKARFVEVPSKDGYYDWTTYFVTNANHCKLDAEMLNGTEKERKEYNDKLQEIKNGWNQYAEIMRGNGYTLAPGGGKPADH